MLKAHETLIGLQELKRSLFGPNPKESMSRVRITKGIPHRLQPEDSEMRWPGIEPGSTAWKAAMLAIIPPTHVVNAGLQEL